jgi:molybdopterin adenylyltransferase
MYTAAVITVSDKVFSGERTDAGGPLVAALLKEAGYDVRHTALVPDEQPLIEQALIHAADELDIALCITTGGTGFSPRDVTPEATLAVCPRLAPGIPEAMRAESMRITPRGCLSRAQAGIRGGTLIVNLPGSTKAIRENLGAVLPALVHGLETLRGPKQDCGAEP